jgi:response regulator of citrate/malate metabolism
MNTMDSITTLIVEDEPMLAEILVDTIKQFPQFEVIGIADKLESAKKMLRLYQPQLTLLDNFLPDGKGLDLIRHAVNTHYKGRIIFITADNHMDTISEALRMGVFDYLIKPVHYQRLQHTLSVLPAIAALFAQASRQARPMLTPCSISRQKSTRKPQALRCGVLMRAPLIGYYSSLPTRKRSIPQTPWPVFSAVVKPPPAATLSRALKTISLRLKSAMAKSADRSGFITVNILRIFKHQEMPC